MNIYRFINSRDIRKHLKDLKYEFNALEASWLVYQCRGATLEEKKQAWTWIIDNMPDMEVRERPNCSYRKSLHDTLRKYMEVINELLERFSSLDDPVYRCRFYYRGKESGGTMERDVSFSLKECIKIIKEYMKDLEETEQKGTYVAVERHFRDSYSRISVVYDTQCRIISVDERDCSDEYYNLLRDFFDGLWFDFPTPFKKGDIVFNVGDNIDDSEDDAICCGFFVLGDMLTWGLDEKRKKIYLEGGSGDNSDMTFYGYYLDDERIYYECNWTYMDLEYYHGPFTGRYRILKALSSLVKEEIGIELFLHAYNIFIKEKQLRELTKYSRFTDEGLKLAGLLEEN